MKKVIFFFFHWPRVKIYEKNHQTTYGDQRHDQFENQEEMMRGELGKKPSQFVTMRSIKQNLQESF